jgi:transposase-like protein
VLPLLYLHGLSGGDLVPALEQFLGTSAGLSASTITRLTEQWQDEQKAFCCRDLSAVDYVYVWADGIHVNIRLEEHKLCLLVIIGVRADGSKEHLRTTNPIESTFATVRHRTKITRGPGSKAAGLAIAFKLIIIAAQDRWWAVNAPHLVALVRAGAGFINGQLVERSPDQTAAEPPVETAA